MMYFNNIQNIQFKEPNFLWLLPFLLGLCIWYYLVDIKDRIPLSYPSTKPVLKSFWSRFRPILYVFRILALSMLVLALARMQFVKKSLLFDEKMGLDIILAIDVSPSMAARDLKPDRMAALRGIAREFVRNRINDRIGLVVYSGDALSLVPLSLDKELIDNKISQLQYGMVGDGTAIGDGLGVAVNHLKGSKAKSKLVILLTDGVNNTGLLDPINAAEIAKSQNIKVYTIAVGTNGVAEFPVGRDPFTGNLYFDTMEVEIDEEVLQNIAQITGARYFRATNNQSLAQIYRTINTLEKTKFFTQTRYQYQDKYVFFIALALFFLFLEGFLRVSIYRSFV